MSEVPASIFITCAESELGRASSPAPNSSATTVKVNHDLVWGDITITTNPKVLRDQRSLLHAPTEIAQDAALTWLAHPMLPKGFPLRARGGGTLESHWTWPSLYWRSHQLPLPVRTRDRCFRPAQSPSCL